jgi:hypothetical protein
MWVAPKRPLWGLDGTEPPSIGGDGVSGSITGSTTSAAIPNGGSFFFQTTICRINYIKDMGLFPVVTGISIG